MRENAIKNWISFPVTPPCYATSSACSRLLQSCSQFPVPIPNSCGQLAVYRSLHLSKFLHRSAAQHWCNIIFSLRLVAPDRRHSDRQTDRLIDSRPSSPRLRHFGLSYLVSSRLVLPPSIESITTTTPRAPHDIRAFCQISQKRTGNVYRKPNQISRRFAR